MSEDEPLCPACKLHHRPASPCYAGPAYHGPALYAEAATHAEFNRINEGIPAARVARHFGVSEQFISMIRTGKKRPTERILRDLGFEKVTFYRRISR